MLKSFMSRTPTIDHSVQLMKQASVNGRGIDSADFVSTTVFSAASGLANKQTQKNTPALPIKVVAVSFESENATNRVNVIMIEQVWMCCDTVPGRFDAVFEQ